MDAVRGSRVAPFTLAELREMLVEINATAPVLTPETFLQQVVNERREALRRDEEAVRARSGEPTMTQEERERMVAGIEAILAPPPRAWIVEE